MAPCSRYRHPRRSESRRGRYVGRRADAATRAELAWRLRRAGDAEDQLYEVSLTQQPVDDGPRQAADRTTWPDEATMTEPDHSPPHGNSYEAYARFCLDLASKQPDRRHRLLLREMAAAWLNVADGTAPDGHAPR